MSRAYKLDVPTDSALRCASVGGDTLFVLATRTSGAGLGCRVTAFDLARGRRVATLDLPYIKHDNGGGTLSPTTTGRRVAVGAEFSIFIHDLVNNEFVPRATLDTEQETCSAKFIGCDRTIHWCASKFVSTDLQTGESYEGPDLESQLGSLADFSVEGDAEHLLAVGDSERDGAAYRTALQRIRVRDFELVRSYWVPGRYVVMDPFVGRPGRAHVLADAQLLEVDTVTGGHRVVHGNLSRALLSGACTCMALSPSGMLCVVTRDELVTIDLERSTNSARRFPQPVRAAGLDAHGRVWTLDAGAKVRAWDLV